MNDFTEDKSEDESIQDPDVEEEHPTLQEESDEDYINQADFANNVVKLVVRNVATAKQVIIILSLMTTCDPLYCYKVHHSAL